MRKKFPPIQPNVLESICKILGDSLTNTEIDKYLPDSNLKNISPVGTKWKRVYNSFINSQNANKTSNSILRFIQITLHPSRYLSKPDEFESFRFELNMILSFIELELGSDAIFRSVQRSKTISDAQNRATSLLEKLKERNVHSDVLKFCIAELLVDNYFHAVFEAVKSVADKIRDLSGIANDGNKLIDVVFSMPDPILKINSLNSETEQSEHKGFANLLRGLFGMFRNTLAHSPKIKWEMKEIDALDIMSMVSLCHRKLDCSTKTFN